ncbi:MAG TPA: transglycosylase domain-containing protein [Verrucomicrobiae bacterium]|nr:transglycosylase domain-containing protein [Verrucomicrobiae bacterium]
MSDRKPRPRKTPKNTYTTSSGKSIKLNRSIGDRVKASREAKAQRKAAYLSSLPKERWKRILWRLEPKRMYHYWFSRDGLIMMLKLIGVGVVAIFLLMVGLFAYFRKDLPKIQDINSNNGGGNVSYYDRTGQTLLWHESGAFKRIPVTSNDISPYMKEATIAVEDKDFYHEGAFNIKGIVRAAVNNLRGGSTQGGSTITQQLVKLNEGWTDDHTISRKVKELILAVELEREYSKDDILTAYLNTAPYSGTDYGVQAAAEDYFHVNASQLSLAQAAMLASIPKAPTAYSPYSSPNWNQQATGYLFDQNGLVGRQEYILDLMAQQGYITQAQADNAKQVPIISQVQPKPDDQYAGIPNGFQYAVLSADAELKSDFPTAVVANGDLKVITTIDVNLQNLADNALSSHAKLLHGDDADDASFVAENNTTGQIVALVGGMDFNTQQLDFASQAPISPGSSIKPYSYATLINDNNNVGAGSMLADSQGALPGYPCTDKATPEADPTGSNCLWDDTRHYNGDVTLRYALGSSLNVPAVKAFTSTDPNDTSTAASGSTWRLASINTTMKSINTFMGGSGSSDDYKCYLPGTELSAASQADETQCGAAAGIGNEAYTTLVDHVNGISTLARMGQEIPSTLILQVTNASGKVIKQFQQPKATPVVRQDAAYIVTNMAADPGASYLTGSCNTTNCTGMKFHRYKGWQIAIKTGTNQNLDGLMMSWDTQYSAGVWIGNYNRSAYGGSPENVTDPIMKQFMEGAIDNLGNIKPDNWVQPADIKVLPAYHSVVPFKSESAPPSADLFPSWYVGKTTTGATQTIDKVSGLPANACTPTDAKETIGGSSSSALNVDIYSGGHPNVSTSSSAPTTSSDSTAPQATDNVHTCGDTLPSATITAVCDTTGANCSTSNFSCPLTGCTITVVVQAGTHPLTDPQYPNYPGTLALIVNGQTVQSQQVNSSGTYQLTYTPPAGSTGSIQITAQVTDSVLYQQSDTQTLNIPQQTTSFREPTTSGGAGDGHNPPNGVLTSFRKH